MSLQGDLGAIPLADVMQMIAGNRLSGTLYVASNEEARVLTFSQGLITTGSSLEQRFLLGKALCRHGLIDPIQLAEALRQQRERGGRLGQTLLELGLVEEDDLDAVVRDQVQAVMNDVFRWRRGGFLFADSAGHKDQGAEGYAVQPMLMESLRATDEWEEVAKRFGERRAVPQLIGPEDAVGDTPVPLADGTSSDALAVLELIDGYRSVEQLVLRSGWTDHRALSALAELIDAGLVRFRTGTTSRTVAPTYQGAFGAHVPVFPRTGARAIAIAISETPTDLELREVTLSDPGLAVAVIRTAGALATDGRRVRSMSRAIELLGSELTRRALVGGGLRGLYAGDRDWSRWWRHSLATSVAARLVARVIAERPEEIEVARLVGLVHDVGVPLLAHDEPDQYKDVQSDLLAGESRLIDIERKKLGVGHDTVGAHTLEAWGVASVIREAVLLHHAGTASVPPMAAVAALADSIATRHGFGLGKRVPAGEAATGPACQALGLSEADCKAIERSFLQTCAVRDPLW